jgi:hypothetical protein
MSEPSLIRAGGYVSLPVISIRTPSNLLMAINLKNYINQRELFHRPVKINVEKFFHHQKLNGREGQI